MEKETKSKRTIEFFANNNEGALELKSALEKKDYEINHILSASSVPIAIERDKYGKISDVVHGAGNIRMNYLV